MAHTEHRQFSQDCRLGKWLSYGKQFLCGNQHLPKDWNFNVPGAAPAITLGAEFAFPRECVVFRNLPPELRISRIAISRIAILGTILLKGSLQ